VSKLATISAARPARISDAAVFSLRPATLASANLPAWNSDAPPRTPARRRRAGRRRQQF